MAPGSPRNRQGGRHDQLANGEPRVGAIAELTRVVETRDIALFTEISGDRNPLHYDAEAAAATQFGEMEGFPDGADWCGEIFQ